VAVPRSGLRTASSAWAGIPCCSDCADVEMGSAKRFEGAALAGSPMALVLLHAQAILPGPVFWHRLRAIELAPGRLLGRTGYCAGL